MSMDDFIKTLSDEQKASLLKALSSNVEDEQPEQDSKEEFKVTGTKKPLTNNRRREPVKARKNEWVDTGEFKDIETKYGDRTPRNRQPHKKVDVECSVCGKSFKLDPKFTYGEYHRCNRCVGK